MLLLYCGGHNYHKHPAPKVELPQGPMALRITAEDIQHVIKMFEDTVRRIEAREYLQVTRPLLT